MLMTLAHAATLALGLVAAPQMDASELIDWRMTQTDTQREMDEVTLLIRLMSGQHSSSHTSRTYPIRSLPGVDAGSLNSPSRMLMEFTLPSDAGRLDCEGTAKNGTGSGECDFEPNRQFGNRLQAMGIDKPTDKELFRLTLASVSMSDIRAMQRWGYGDPDLDTIVAFAIHGVDDEFVQSFKETELEPKDLNQLLAFQIHGVDADYVESIRGIGPRFSQLSGDDLLAFRIHGATPDAIRAILAFDVGDLGPDEVLAFRIHGVTAEFIDELRVIGDDFDQLNADDLVRFAIHGVDGEFIEAFAEIGYSDLSPDTLVSFRIHGVTTEYASSFNEKSLPKPTPERLIRMKISDFDPERIDDR